jgi:hypothetical protein
MGTRSPKLAIVVAVAALGLALTASASPTPPRLTDARKNATPVDVELVIAVDVSYSIDPDEQALPREGYVLALTSKEFLCSTPRRARQDCDYLFRVGWPIRPEGHHALASDRWS